MQVAGENFGVLSAALVESIAGQEEAETARVAIIARTQGQFLWILGGLASVVLAMLLVGGVLLNGQIDQADEFTRRSNLARDRQQCATALQVEWDTKLGDAFAIAGKNPPPARDSEEYQEVIRNLNEATALIHRVDELCNGPVPNPDPVP